MSDVAPERNWGPLTAPERRVLGVLIEKSKTTPDNYPLSVAATVTGCNQKTARDPITNYDADDVEETLQSLRKKGAAVMVDAGGRVLRWKHALYDWLKVSRVEAAVLGELLLRGAQTEGDLRARASRMESIPDLPTLQGILQSLAQRGMVVYLTPPGVRRGVIVTHGFFSPEGLDRERHKHAQAIATADDDEAPLPSRAAIATHAAAAAPDPMLTEELNRLSSEVARQGELIQDLFHQLKELKSALGVE